MSRLYKLYKNLVDMFLYKEDISKNKEETSSYKKEVIPPGRISSSNDDGNLVQLLQGQLEFVTPSFRKELIPLIRGLYKINPDMGIAVQDMFKLANTGHRILFPYNSDKEAKAMRKHLKEVSKDWLNYTSSTFGASNKMIVQLLVGGAISVEAVPKKDLSGISTLVFVKPEDIIFKRDEDGQYKPYQINKTWKNSKDNLIELNTLTYKYLSMFNDLDEPYGIPPFMTALDSLSTQADMKINIKHLMEIIGLFGFFEAKMEKPTKMANESDKSYISRLERNLKDLKRNLMDGMKDGIVAGYIDDHEFKLNSTTKDLGNVDRPWMMNQQSVANGLGVSGSLIGVSNDNKTEGGTSIMFSKMISQLKNIQEFVNYTWEFIYSLELRLAGFNNKGIKVMSYPSTITDDLKIQQGIEYRVRNNIALYKQGIIDQSDFAYDMGYESPAEDEPLVPLEELGSDSGKSKKREEDKDKSDRKTRDKNNPVPKRKDGETKER